MENCPPEPEIVNQSKPTPQSKAAETGKRTLPDDDAKPSCSTMSVPWSETSKIILYNNGEHSEPGSFMENCSPEPEIVNQPMQTPRSKAANTRKRTLPDDDAVPSCSTPNRRRKRRRVVVRKG